MFYLLHLNEVFVNFLYSVSIVMHLMYGQTILTYHDIKFFPY